VWDEGDASAASDYLAPTYTVHLDPGDPREGIVLVVDDFRKRVPRSRAAFPDQRFD
jgi:hypothetical protein